MKTETETLPANAGVQFLANFRKGKLATQFTGAMQDVVAGVKEHGKAGTLVLKIKIAPVSEGASQVEVTAEVVAKPPTRAGNAAVFFTNGDNLLQNTDPDQPELPFRSVGGGKTDEAPREIESKA